MYIGEMQLQARDMARQFAEAVVRPLAAALDREERFPGEIYERMGSLGCSALAFPKRWAGRGLIR